MNWLIPALVAPAVYTVINYVDKYIVSKEVRDYKALPIYVTIMGLFAGTLFWAITGFPMLSLRDGVLIVLSGVLTIWAGLFYFEAMASDEASKIILFFQVQPVLVLIFAFVFLREVVLPKQLLGFSLVLFSVLAVSFEGGLKKLNLSRNLILIVLSDLMWAIGAILIKFTINANSFAKILSYESWGIGIGGGHTLFVPIESTDLV